MEVMWLDFQLFKHLIISPAVKLGAHSAAVILAYDHSADCFVFEFLEPFIIQSGSGISLLDVLVFGVSITVRHSPFSFTVVNTVLLMHMKPSQIYVTPFKCKQLTDSKSCVKVKDNSKILIVVGFFDKLLNLDLLLFCKGYNLPFVFCRNTPNSGTRICF